jgi:hypothetical protein
LKTLDPCCKKLVFACLNSAYNVAKGLLGLSLAGSFKSELTDSAVTHPSFDQTFIKELLLLHLFLEIIDKNEHGHEIHDDCDDDCEVRGHGFALKFDQETRQILPDGHKILQINEPIKHSRSIHRLHNIYAYQGSNTQPTAVQNNHLKHSKNPPVVPVAITSAVFSAMAETSIIPDLCLYVLYTSSMESWQTRPVLDGHTSYWNCAVWRAQSILFA